MKKQLKKFFPPIILFILIFLIIMVQKYVSRQRHYAMQIIPVQITNTVGETQKFEGTIYYKANNYFYLVIKNNTDTSYVLDNTKSKLFVYNDKSWEQISDRGVLSNMLAHILDQGATGKITAPGIDAIDLKAGKYRLSFQLRDDVLKTYVEFLSEFKLE